MLGQLTRSTPKSIYHSVNISSLLPSNIERTAFYSYGEHAWRKEDLTEVFAYCLDASVAVVEGECWVVRWLDTGNHIVYRFIPQHGDCTAVFSWHNHWAEQTQSWQSYVVETIQRAKTIIEQAQFEANILPQYKPHIYYKLAFERQDGFCF